MVSHNQVTENEREANPLKILGYSALAVIALGNSMEYRLPQFNEPIDVPGLSAKVIPGYAHNSGYDCRLRESALVVESPGRYMATLSHEGQVLTQSNFTVLPDNPKIVQLGGTPRGGIAGQLNAGLGWGTFPGQVTLNLKRVEGELSESYQVHF